MGHQNASPMPSIGECESSSEATGLSLSQETGLS